MVHLSTCLPAGVQLAGGASEVEDGGAGDRIDGDLDDNLAGPVERHGIGGGEGGVHRPFERSQLGHFGVVREQLGERFREPVADHVEPGAPILELLGLQKKYGAEFKAPKLLIDMADKGETFYQRFDPYAKAEEK